MRHRNIEQKLIYREHFFALALTSLELMNVVMHWS